MNLDCETLESTELSLAAILGLEKAQLLFRLQEFTETDFEVSTDIVDDRWRPMLNAVAGGEIADTDDGHTCWFHATRAKDVASFRAGIRSLPRQLNETWAALYPLVSDCVTPEEWTVFRREVERDNYGGHSPDVIRAWMSNEGPYAFLFAESALNPRDTSNHDYLGTSELVEFISICFERTYRVSLDARHRAATQPTLIKFATAGIKAAHVGAALDYVFHRLNRWPITCLDPCFSGEGRPVAPGQMRKAIPVVESVQRLGRHSVYSLSPSSRHIALRS